MAGRRAAFRTCLRSFASIAQRVLAILPPAFFCINSLPAMAVCSNSLPLSGTETIPGCDTSSEACIPAERALHAYMEKVPDSRSVLTIGLHASPWRFYDPDYRIATVEEIAERARPAIARGAKRVVLYVSWSSVRPEKGMQSLAERLSAALGGIPVQGFDGFLWFRADGAIRTTRQAASVRSGGAYQVKAGDEVMASMVAGYPLFFTDKLVATHDGAIINVVAAAWDILGLCPDNALNLFQKAAEAGNPIGAYNAAMVRIERGTEDDLTIAEQLLQMAADLGDVKSRSRLERLMAAAQTAPAVQSPKAIESRRPADTAETRTRPESDMAKCLSAADNFAVAACVANIEKARRQNR